MSSPSDCVFCRILRGEIPSDRVYEDESVFAFRDIKPAARTHILVIPKRHVERLSACGEDDAGLLAGVLLGANRVARQEGLSDFRLIINDGPGAGQTVFHLHAHVLAGPELGDKLI